MCLWTPLALTSPCLTKLELPIARGVPLPMAGPAALANVFCSAPCVGDVLCTAHHVKEDHVLLAL